MTEYDLKARVAALEFSLVRQREQLVQLRILVRVLGRALAWSVTQDDDMPIGSEESLGRAWALKGAIDCGFWQEEDRNEVGDEAMQRIMKRVEAELNAIADETIRLATPPKQL